MILVKKTVVFDHDGGIDDLLSLILVLCMDNISLVGVCITPADCYPDDAVESTLKILAMFGAEDVPVTVGNIIGPNPFPADWRAQPRFCRALPSLLRANANTNQLLEVPAHEWLHQYLSNTQEKVSLLLTGPASNLAHVIAQSPDLKCKISQVVWMGGAINVKGNVAMHDHNGSAEWNAYWHPQATRDLLAAQLPLVLVPLDATNSFPVSWSFLKELAALDTPLSELAGQFWAATVTAVPTYEFTYFMWDVLATCLLSINQGALAFESGYLNASVRTPDAGNIFTCDAELGYQATWLHQANIELVTDFIFELFRTKNSLLL